MRRRWRRAATITTPSQWSFERLLTKIQTMLEERVSANDDFHCTLLVVDDNEVNRDLLSRRLQRHGYRRR